MRKAELSPAHGSLVFTRPLALYELDGEEADRDDKQRVDEPALV
jgi:hypothetical protein